MVSLNPPYLHRTVHCSPSINQNTRNLKKGKSKKRSQTLLIHIESAIQVRFPPKQLQAVSLTTELLSYKDVEIVQRCVKWPHATNQIILSILIQLCSCKDFVRFCTILIQLMGWTVEYVCIIWLYNISCIYIHNTLHDMTNEWKHGRFNNSNYLGWGKEFKFFEQINSKFVYMCC